MLSPLQLQFRLMTPEAQRTAVQRLALRGWDAKTISTQTGMAEAEVRLSLRDAWTPPLPYRADSSRRLRAMSAHP
jgi:hypothetical protein